MVPAPHFWKTASTNRCPFIWRMADVDNSLPDPSADDPPSIGIEIVQTRTTHQGFFSKHPKGVTKHFELIILLCSIMLNMWQNRKHKYTCDHGINSKLIVRNLTRRPRLCVFNTKPFKNFGAPTSRPVVSLGCRFIFHTRRKRRKRVRPQDARQTFELCS